MFFFLPTLKKVQNYFHMSVHVYWPYLNINKHKNNIILLLMYYEIDCFVAK